MQRPFYLDLEQARQTLADMGIVLTERQMKRAAEKDPHGRRKAPFFVDPIDGRLKIEKNALLSLYINRQVQAEQHLKL